MQKLTLALLTWGITSPALAHHPLGGQPARTLLEGLLSGIGHPFIGYDHFFFVLLVGIAAAFCARPRLAPAAYVIAMLAGCATASLWQGQGITNLMVALSLLTLGGLLMSGRRWPQPLLLTLFAAFGLFHGFSFAAGMAVAESALGLLVLSGYLAGLGAIQYLLALAPGFIFRNVWQVGGPGNIYPRLASAVVAGMGLLMTLEQIGARW